MNGTRRTFRTRCRRGHLNPMIARFCSTCGVGLPLYRFQRRIARRWYWLMGRTFWRFYPPAVTRGPLTCWLWKQRHGHPCSDEILRDAYKARAR